MRSVVAGALQLPTLGMNATRMEFYLKNAAQRGARLMLFGEYVLNHFFKELEKMPLSMVGEQSQMHIRLLKRFSIEYAMTFVAPVVRVKSGRAYKCVVKISGNSVRYYTQQILMPYRHWNEKEFFANETTPLKEPMSFTIDGMKIAVISGYELHFDPIWESIGRKKIDLVLLPTASTFGSHNRWRELIKCRAFIHGCYILRANRLGEYNDGENRWRFYGDSMLVKPSGEVEMMLEDRESMLIEPIERSEVSQHRRAWMFEKELALRDAIAGEEQG